MKKRKVKWGKRLLFTLMFSFLLVNIQAQISVSGTVTDNNGEGLIGVSVAVKGTTVGTVTDLKGDYSLDVANANATLVFSYIGYEAQEVSLNGRRRVNVVLIDIESILDEVVVVAYGSQKKVNVTGAISQVTNRELKTAPNGNISSMLQGRLPGLVSKQTSGQPGSDGSSLYVRGLGAGDGNLLVVVDGFIRSFPSVNVDEIESITILKDATAAAAYGVRGSAGVMMITTKRGSVQKPTVTFNTSVSLSSNTNFAKFLNGPDYAYWYDKAEEMDGVAEENRRFTRDEMNRIINGDPEGVYGNTDWFDLLFRDSAPTYTNNVSLSGGSEKFKYFISLGAYNQQGIMKRTSFDRYNVRANLDAQVTDNFSISFGLAGREAKTLQPGLSAGIGNAYASIFSQALMAYPYLPAYTESGIPVGSLNGAGNGNQNPLAARDLSGEQKTKETKIQGNISLKYDIPKIKGLSLKLNAAYDKGYSMKKSALLPYKLSVFNQATRTWSEDWARHSLTGDASVNQWFADTYEYTLQPAIEYSNKFGKHAVSGLFLYEYTRKVNSSLSAGKKGYPIQDIMDITFGEEIIADLIKGGHGMDRRAGYVGRLNYAYDDKYLFEFTARYDGTPYLPGEFRWGFFPGVSAGWRISQESFFQEKFPFIENLKLRASAGRLGSDSQLGYSYSYLATVSMGKDPVVMFGDKLNRYLSVNRPPNIYLKWQVTDTYNIGLESNMWNGLLGVELDMFYSKTSRILENQSANYPPSLGTYYPANINNGVRENKGFELVLTHQNKISDFSYNVRGNLSWARNKILKITDNVNDPVYRRSTGQRLGQHYGFEAIGLFQSEEEIANSAVYGPTLPGDIKLRDVNGDGRITWEQDIVPIGKSSIPEMMFGLNINGQYKNFDFSMFFQGAAIVDVALCGLYSDKGVYDNTFYTKPFYVDGNTPYYLVEKAWTPENTNAEYPRLGIVSRDNGGKFSSWWMVDGSYLRLKSAQIGYTIPRSITNRIGLEKIRAYVSGSNLFTLSHLKHLDPEMPNVNQGYYPQQRVFEFGLNLTF